MKFILDSLFTTKLEGPPADITANGRYLFVLTTTCQARVFDVKSGKAIFPASTAAHVIEPDLHSIDLSDNGSPIVLSTASDAYAFDPDLQSWVPICESRLLEHDIPSGREVQGTLSRIEQDCRSSLRPMANGNDEEPEWFKETQQMAIMEMRMRASVLLGSRDEYRYWLSQYASFLGRNEFIGRAEELLKELVGPLYQSVQPTLAVRISPDISRHPGRPSTWQSEVLGLRKRDLAGTTGATMCTSFH